MKTAVILASENRFDKEVVLKNDPIKWLDALYDEYGTLDIDDIFIFPSVEEYVHDYNAGCCHSADDFIVLVNYTSFDGKRFVNDSDMYSLSVRFCAKVREQEHSGEERQDIANEIYNIVCAKFGADINVDIYGYWNDVTDYRYHIYVRGDKCRILNNLKFFCNEVEDISGICFCETEWSADGSDFDAISYEGDEEQWISKVAKNSKPDKNDKNESSNDSICLKNNETQETETQEDDDEEDLEGWFHLDANEEMCYIINSDYYLYVMKDDKYDQWSYALYNKQFELITRDWTCGIDVDTWKSILKDDVSQHVGGKIYNLLNISPKLFLHLKNA